MSPSEIEVHPAAVKEARKAYRWYLRRSATAAGRFKAALQAALSKSSSRPTAGRPICTERAIVFSAVVDLLSCTATEGSVCRSWPWRTARNGPDTGKGANSARSKDPEKKGTAS